MGILAINAKASRLIPFMYLHRQRRALLPTGRLVKTEGHRSVKDLLLDAQEDAEEMKPVVNTAETSAYNVQIASPDFKAGLRTTLSGWLIRNIRTLTLEEWEALAGEE